MSDSREIRTVAGVFKAMHARFNARKVPPTFAARYEFRVGPGTYAFEFADGRLTITAGAVPNPDIIITISEADLFAMMHGKLTGQRAFAEERITFEGDLKYITVILPQLFE